jgi:hypothetical protein
MHTAPSASGLMASPLFCHRFLNNFGLQTLIGIHFFQPTVLFFKLFQSCSSVPRPSRQTLSTIYKKRYF